MKHSDKILAFKTFRNEQLGELRQYKRTLGLCVEFTCCNEKSSDASRCDYHLEKDRKNAAKRKRHSTK